MLHESYNLKRIQEEFYPITKLFQVWMKEEMDRKKLNKFMLATKMLDLKLKARMNDNSIEVIRNGYADVHLSEFITILIALGHGDLAKTLNDEEFLKELLADVVSKCKKRHKDLRLEELQKKKIEMEAEEASLREEPGDDY